MIGFLRGKIHYYNDEYVLLDVNNVGYRIFFNHPEQIKKDEERIFYTYENIREDEQSLYGFLSIEEYDLFVKLISVKGLGPKIASGILAKASVEKIINAIEKDDVGFIKSMPGIGGKTASQIILDLKGKLISEVKPVLNSKMEDVSNALKSLGYKTSEIKPVIAKLSNDDLSVDECIKKALGMLVK